jgi:hypothetical protein
MSKPQLKERLVGAHVVASNDEDGVDSPPIPFDDNDGNEHKQRSHVPHKAATIRRRSSSNAEEIDRANGQPKQLQQHDSAGSDGAAAHRHPHLRPQHPHSSAPLSPFAPGHFFATDATATAAGVSLTPLNGPEPDTLEQALAQLAIAKCYIQRVQEVADRRAAAHASYGSHGAKVVSAAGGNMAVNGHEPLLSNHVLELESRSSPRDEASGDFLATGPPEMSPDDYYNTPWWKLVLKRLPWLVVLLLLQSFGALILNHYNKLIEKHLVLNFFIPMMQGTSGNAGNQPGVMVARAVSQGKLRLGELLSKELIVCLLCATTLGFVAYARIIIVSFRLQAQHSNLSKRTTHGAKREGRHAAGSVLVFTHARVAFLLFPFVLRCIPMILAVPLRSASRCSARSYSL